MICLILLGKFREVLPAVACARAIDNFFNIFLGVNIFSPSPFVAFIRNILLLKTLRVNSRPS